MDAFVSRLTSPLLQHNVAGKNKLWTNCIKKFYFMNYGGKNTFAECNSVYIVKKNYECSKAIYTREWELNQMFSFFF